MVNIDILFMTSWIMTCSYTYIMVTINDKYVGNKFRSVEAI